jgi:eukaryotic-like serine/threonine-protein kinase
MENLQGGTLALPHNYHIDRRIGSRGFVTLYEATQEPFTRPVLVTVYDRAFEAGAEPALFQAIKSRANAASALDHRGILRTVDYGELDHGIPFVIGEFLHRPTSLQNLLDQDQTLAPEQVLELVEALAKILDQAHAQGIMHGGLAPHWIFFPSAEDLSNLYVAHFNLGFTLDETLDLPNGILSASSIGALPPDRYRQRETQRSAAPASAQEPFSIADDVYALGTIAYQALVGVHPFFDDPTDVSEGLIRIKGEDPADLSTLGIEKEVSKVVARALARDPSRRFSTPTEFATALREAIMPAPAQEPASLKTRQPLTSPVTTPVSEPPKVSAAEGVHRSQVPISGPAPGGYAFMAVIALLLFSNLAWFFAYLATDPTAVTSGDSASDPIVVSTRTLPGGLQIKSEPVGADIFLVTGDQSTRLGSTPHVVTDALQNHPNGHLILKKNGFHDQRIELQHGPGGSDLVLHLAPRP